MNMTRDIGIPVRIATVISGAYKGEIVTTQNTPDDAQCVVTFGDDDYGNGASAMIERKHLRFWTEVESVS